MLRCTCEKRKRDKVTKNLKILCPWLSAKFYSACYIFTNSSNCFGGNLLNVFKKRPGPNLSYNYCKQSYSDWNLLNLSKKLPGRNFQKPNLDLSEKIGKRVIKKEKKLALFYNVVAIILGRCCVKGLIMNKVIMGLGFEGAWSELEARSCSQKQLCPRILSLNPFGNL